MMNIRQIALCFLIMLACLQIGLGQNAPWQIGERFVFQPSSSTKATGYYTVLDTSNPTPSRYRASLTAFPKGSAVAAEYARHLREREATHLGYSTYAGTIAKVVAVQRRRDPLLELPQDLEMVAVLESELDGTRITMDSGQMFWMIPLSRIEALRTAFKGKTLWFRSCDYVPVNVVDVQISDRVLSPARFVLQKSSGELVHMDRQLNDPFLSDAFFTRDPRQIFPAQIWFYIEKGKVRLGMTEDQARASWGPPASINRTRTRHGVSEQWVYNGWYLYFTNGRLTAVQD